MNRKLLTIWFVGAAYALSGCGDEAGGQEPGSSVKRLVEYLNEGRRQDAKELFSGAIQAEFEAGLFEELSTAVTRDGRVTGIEVRDERIEGTKATVLIRISYLDQQPPGYFVPKLVYQDGMWRLDDFRVNELRELSKIQLGPLAVSEGGDLYLRAGRKLLRSTNRGETWSAMSQVPGSIVALAANASGHLFAGTRANGLFRLFRTLDRGDSWTEVAEVRRRVWSLAVSDQGTMYLGTDIGVYVSTDDGSTWSAANQGLPRDIVRSIVIAPSGAIFVLCGGRVCRSNDQGSKWLEVFRRNAPARVLAAARSGEVYVGIGYYLFRSIDDGKSWHQIAGRFPGNNIRALTFDSNGQLLALGEGTVFRSNDRGESWVGLSARLQGSFLQAVVIGEDDYIFAESVGHLVRSSDGGDTWTDVASKADFAAMFLFAQPL